MSVPIRDLVARFSFETDPQGVRRFNDTVGSMRRTIAGVAGALGIGLGVRQLTRWATGLEDAAAMASVFTKDVRLQGEGLERTVEITGELGRQFETLQQQVPNKLLSEDFLSAFANFRQFVKDGNLQEFGTLFKGAALIARATGSDVQATFGGLMQTVTSGSLDFLREVIPNLDEADRRVLEFVRSLTDNIDPTGVQQLSRNLGQTTRILRENETALLGVSEVMGDTVGGEGRDLLARIREIGGEIALNLSGPILEAIESLNDFLRAADDAGGGLAGIAKVAEDRFPGVVRVIQTIADMLRDLWTFLTTGRLSDNGFFASIGANVDEINRKLEGFRQNIRDMVQGVSEALSFIPSGLRQSGVNVALEDARSGTPRDPIARAVRSIYGGLLGGQPERQFSVVEIPDREAARGGPGVIVAPTFNISGPDPTSIATMVNDKLNQLLRQAAVDFKAGALEGSVFE